MSPPTLADPLGRDSGTSNEIRSEARVPELISAAREGDRQSLGELLANYRAYLTLLGSMHFQRRLQARVSPSDIVQETLLRAHRNFEQFRGQSERELMGWLREILVNALARFVEQHVHAAKRDVRREVSLAQFAETVGNHLQESPAANEPAPADGALAGEDSVLLAHLLSQLPEHYREVLVLRNIEGLSFDQVATRLDRSPGATRMLWLRAIEKLRAAHRKAEPNES